MDDRKLENHSNDDKKCRNENFEIAKFIEHIFLSKNRVRNFVFTA